MLTALAVVPAGKLRGRSPALSPPEIHPCPASYHRFGTIIFYDYHQWDVLQANNSVSNLYLSAASISLPFYDQLDWLFL
jgi:hypothetical protein